MASLPGSVSCLFCNGAVNFMQGGKDKFYKHLTGEHDIHLNHNLIMAINFLDKETLQEIVTQFEASYNSEAGNLPGSVSCLLCNGAVSFKEGGKEKFYKHLKGEHDIFLNESLVMAINFLDQETLQEIVKQFEMSYNLIMSNEEESKGAETVVDKEDIIMETLNEAENMKGEALNSKTTVVVDDSKNTIDVDDNDDNCITLDDEPMILEHKKPPAKKYKTFECSVCKAPFDYAWMLSTHMKSHEKEKNTFACDQCSKTFDSSSNLQKHTTAAHKKSVLAKTVPPKRFNPNKSLPVTNNKVNPTKRMSMDIGKKLGGLSSTNISKVKVDRVSNANVNKVKLGGTSNTNISKVKIPESISVMGPGLNGKKVVTSITAARDVAAKSVAEKQAKTLAALTRVGVSVSKASPKKAVGLSSGISITKVEPPPPPKPMRTINLDSSGLDSLRKLGILTEDKPQIPTQNRGRPPVQRAPYQRNSTGNTPAQRKPYIKNSPTAQGNTPGQRNRSIVKMPSQKDSAPLENKPLLENKTVQGRIPVAGKAIKTMISKKPALKACEVCKKQFTSNDLLSKHILSCVSGEIRGVAKSSKSIARKTKEDVDIQSLFQNGQTRPTESPNVVKESLNVVKDSLTNTSYVKAEDASENSSNIKIEDPLAISSGNKDDANKEVLDNLNDIISMLEDDSNVTKKIDDPFLPEKKKIENSDLDMEVTDNIELEAAIKYL